MKKLLLVALVLFLAPMALAAEEAATEPVLEPLAQTSEAVDIATDDAATDEILDEAGLPANVLAYALAQTRSSYECPEWTTYCWRDSQCDSFCGGSGGACTFGCCRCAF